MTIPTNPAALSVLADGCLEGRSALVTGGGSGIGRATALLLARLGARVAVTGRREEELAQTVQLAAEANSVHPVLAVACDVREPENVDVMLDAVFAEHEFVDVLVNNAGGQFMAPAESISYNGFRAVTRLNLDATWYVTTQVASRSMIERGYGKIVSITMTPRRGLPGMSHSSAARAGVESLTRTLSVEWGKYGIRTAAIAPGIVHTAAWENYGLDPDMMGSKMPTGRLQSADDVASLVGFLVSPGGDYISGATIAADGGFSNLYPIGP
ncbi:MAG: SDR family oxidoreductase [Candidatus Nanopelagicales bacterium]